MLYNLGDDGGELENLASSTPEKVHDLPKRIEFWEKGMIVPLWQEGKGYIAIRKNKNVDYRDASEVHMTLGGAKKEKKEKEK
jgi:hypothetical protein